MDISEREVREEMVIGNDTSGRETELPEEEEKEMKVEETIFPTVIVTHLPSAGSSRKSSNMSDTSGSSLESYPGYIDSGFQSEASDYRLNISYHRALPTMIPEEIESQESFRLSCGPPSHANSPEHVPTMSTAVETAV